MDDAMSAKLMADFPPEQVGYLPRSWCRACSDATKDARRPSACERHEVKPCDKCRTRITTAHVDLDFVGHADVRARLCETDPCWTWEPYFAWPGGPIVTDNGRTTGLWILLTIGGVAKPGYGSVELSKAAQHPGEATKELIGDALRNAAQSFGVAWKLWAKGDRSGQEGDRQASHSDTPQAPAPQAPRPRKPRTQPRQQQDQPAPPEANGNGKRPPTTANLIAMHFKRLGIDDDGERHNWVARMAGRTELASTSNLPQPVQERILDAVSRARDIGKVQAWIDDQAPAS